MSRVARYCPWVSNTGLQTFVLHCCRKYLCHLLINTCVWASGTSTYEKVKNEGLSPRPVTYTRPLPSVVLMSRLWCHVLQGIALGLQTQVCRPSFYTFVISAYATCSYTGVYEQVAQVLTTKVTRYSPWVSNTGLQTFVLHFCRKCLCHSLIHTCLWASDTSTYDSPGCQTAKPWTKYFSRYILINQVNRLEEMLGKTAACKDGGEDVVWALGCACWGGVIFEWGVFLGVIF